MNIPSTPTRAWKIAQENNLSVEQTESNLNTLEGQGKVVREAGTIIEGSGEYWYSPE